MFGLSETTMHKLQTLFGTYPAIDEAIIYGSRSRGDYQKGSDIDLTFTGSNLSQDMLLRLSNDIDDLLLPYNVDISILQDINNPTLKHNIQTEGKILYKR